MTSSSPRRPCSSLCGAYLHQTDRHRDCYACLGLQHARDGLLRIVECEACRSFDLNERVRRFQAASALAAHEHAFVEPLPPAEPVRSPPSERGRSAHRHSSHAEQRPDPQWSGAASLAGYRDVDEDASSSSGEESSSSSPRGVRSVAVSTRGHDDDASSVASSSRPDLEPAVETFRKAVARLGLAMPQPPSSSASAAAAAAMPGEREVRTDAPKIHKHLPAAPAFQANLHWTWDTGALPLKAGFPIDILDAEGLGLGKLPSVDARLAAILEAQFGKTKENPYSLRAGQLPALAEKSARQLSKANATMYERTSRVASNLNASAILIGSLSLMLKDMAAVSDPSPEVREMLRHTELLASLNRFAIQWSGYNLGASMRFERERWMEPVALKPHLSAVTSQLRDLSCSPTDLFPGGYQLLKEAQESVKERNEVVAAVCPPERAPTPPTVGAAAKKSRTASSSSERRRGAAAPAKAKAPAGPAAPPKADDSSRRDERPPYKPKKGDRKSRK